MWWPLTLTYIFKVIRPWAENGVRSVASTVLDGFLYIWRKWSLSFEGVSRVTFFSESGNLKFWQIFEIFRPWTWKKKSTVLNGFFPYLAQIIPSMRGCVAYNDLWPWPISSRSFDLDFENCVRSVASTVLDGFFLYLAVMITIIRGCVTCYVIFRIWKFEILANFCNFSALTLKNKSPVLDGFFPYLAQMITSMRGCVAYNDLWPWPISSRSFNLDFENRVRSVTFSVLDWLFPYLPQIITTIRGCVAGAGGYPRRWHRLICVV